MPRIGQFVHKAGLAPLVRRAMDSIGYTIVNSGQVGAKNWLGLRQFPIRTILDIGASQGSLARVLLTPAFPDATIHCFEPSPVVFPLLAKVSAQSGGRIVAHQFGLGERSETLPFHSTADFHFSSSVLPPTDEQFSQFPQTKRIEMLEVEVRRLDDVAPTLAPPIEDDLLIKIDVQGFEDRVIRGGRATIARARACIVEVQVVELYEGQPSFRDIFLEMDALGFAYVGNLDQYSGPNGGVLYFDAVFFKRS